ncbi:MAG: MetQ/NlpA family ABC transporter substrate-binding protein [Tissierellaceae bacterium]
MKRILLLSVALILVLSLAACSKTEKESSEINVGVSFYPMKDILLLIQDDLKEEGYELNIHEFSDYQTPNNLLQNEELDANMIQHDYFLQAFNEANDADLVTIQPIYHATYALYSKDYKSLEEIESGSSITLPDDGTNLSRALYLLGQAGLLSFKDDKTTGLDLGDIEENHKNLVLDDQVPLTSLAQRYTETGMAVMYPTYAKSLELVGDEERLYVEEQDSITEGYAISLVARQDNRDSDKIEALIRHISSDKVRQFLIDEYSWASSPAF